MFRDLGTQKFAFSLYSIGQLFFIADKKKESILLLFIDNIWFTVCVICDEWSKNLIIKVIFEGTFGSNKKINRIGVCSQKNGRLYCRGIPDCGTALHSITKNTTVDKFSIFRIVCWNAKKHKTFEVLRSVQIHISLRFDFWKQIS